MKEPGCSEKRANGGSSRRQMLGRAAATASLLPLLECITGRGSAQAPTQAAPPSPPRRPQGGTGPIQVALITKDHPLDRANFFDLFDSFGEDITWTHVEQPLAELLFDPIRAKGIDLFVLFDRAGRKPRTKEEGRAEDPANRVPRDVNFREPSPELRKGFKALLQQGKPFLFFHHANASWVHTWPEYVEAVGSAADWDYPMKNIRGKDYPYSGFRGGVKQHITVVDKTHPVVQGIGDGYDIEDEVYLCPVFEDSIHPLLRTDFQPIDSNFPMQSARGWHHPPGSNVVGWVKTAEKSPIVYIQHGHAQVAWENPAFRKLMSNAMKWLVSKDAKAWAAAHPSKIFKS